MGYVVPFMNGKGGTGKSVLARTYAVEAARAGASVLIADLDDVQRTSKHWADHRKANGLKPEIRVEVATPRVAYDMADRVGCARHRRAGLDGSRKPENGALVDLLRDPLARQSHGRSFGNGAAAACAEGRKASRIGALAWRSTRCGRRRRSRMTQDARAYLAEVGFKALPGFVRDLKAYEIALLEGKAITETDEKELNDEAFVLVNGIAGAVLEAGKQTDPRSGSEIQTSANATKEGAGDDEEQFREDSRSADVCAPAARRGRRKSASRAMARCAPPTAARRGGPGARCNLRRSCRRNSSAG